MRMSFSKRVLYDMNMSQLLLFIAVQVAFARMIEILSHALLWNYSILISHVESHSLTEYLDLCIPCTINMP